MAAANRQQSLPGRPAFPSVDPETLGAMLCELAYAPSMNFSSGPRAGDLVRLALAGLFAERGATLDQSAPKSTKRGCSTTARATRKQA